MSNILLTWQLPVPSARQRPISHSRIDARVSPELPWTEIAIVTVPTEQLLLEDMAPGAWEFRHLTVDAAGVETDEPAFASIEVDFEAPSGAIAFTATLV